MACIYEGDGFTMIPMGPGFFNEERLALYMRYEMDSRVTAWNSHGLFYKSAKQMQGWMDAIEAGSIISWAIMVGGKYVGVCSLDSINLLYRTAEVTIFIGDPEYWGKGIASNAIGYMLEHGFGRLGLNRIWSGTSETNAAMNKVFENLGFTQEGVFREGMFLNGGFVDIRCWAILAKEYFEC